MPRALYLIQAFVLLLSIEECRCASSMDTESANSSTSQYIRQRRIKQSREDLKTVPSPSPEPSNKPSEVPTSSPCETVVSAAPFPGKKGIGLTLREPGKKGSWEENIPKILALNPSWNYSYNSKRIEQQPAHIEFVPMIYTADKEENLANTINNDILPDFVNGYTQRLIAFHEPDNTREAFMPVAKAVSLWPLLQSTGMPLSSPSPKQSEGSWMLDFMNTAQEDCDRMDYISIHWYGGVSPSHFKKKMRSVYETYGSSRPLILAEFAPADWNALSPKANKFSDETVLAFMKDVLPWLEETEWIAGYAWFPFPRTNAAGTHSALFDSDGSLTTLGRYYSSVSPDNPIGDQSIEVGQPLPTPSPSASLSASPSAAPSFSLSTIPSTSPSASPSMAPSITESASPSLSASIAPSSLPSASPSSSAKPSPAASSAPTRCADKYIAPPPLPGKKGACFTLRDIGKRGSWDVHLPRVIALNPSWNYSWSSKRIEQQPAHIEFVPMIWGTGSSEGLARQLRDNVMPAFEAGLTHRLLGFNEPDAKEQSDLTVQESVSYWPQLEATGMPLVSPAPAHIFKGWMIDFMYRADEECLRMESVAMHWYGGTSVSTFQSSLRRAHEMYGRPILLTEFAPADWSATTPEENRHSPQAVLQFMKAALPWLEEQDWIEGYAWFPFKQSVAPGATSALFDLDGNITKLGEYYASVTPENPRGDQKISF